MTVKTRPKARTVDRRLIIKTYLKLKSKNGTANTLGIGKRTIYRILEEEGYHVRIPLKK